MPRGTADGPIVPGKDPAAIGRLCLFGGRQLERLGGIHANDAKQLGDLIWRLSPPCSQPARPIPRQCAFLPPGAAT